MKLWNALCNTHIIFDKLNNSETWISTLLKENWPQEQAISKQSGKAKTV